MFDNVPHRRLRLPIAPARRLLESGTKKRRSETMGIVTSGNHSGTIYLLGAIAGSLLLVKALLWLLAPFIFVWFM